MEQLSGRVAVVTGAASGIGREMAITFSKAGADVVLADLDRAAQDPGEYITSAMQKLQDAGTDSPATDQTDLIRLLFHDYPTSKKSATSNKMHLHDLCPWNRSRGVKRIANSISLND